MSPKMAEKLAKAILYLRSRNLYVLDKGSKKPGWGTPGAPTVTHIREVKK